jgi:hypothetical protein
VLAHAANERASDEDDATRRRPVSASDGPEDRGAIERQQVAKDLSVRREQQSMVPAPREDQNEDPRPGVVPLLESQPALDGLRVAHSRLAFHEERTLCGLDHRIPGPQVSRDREGHLSSHPERRTEQTLEPLEERQLGAVADRRTNRVISSAELETERSPSCGQLDQVRPQLLVSLEASPLGA